MIINITNIKSKNILILLISLWCAIEFIISPYPYYAKENGVFPTIPLGSLSFDLSELLIYGFIGFSLIVLANKFLYTQKVSLGYGYNKYLVLAFIVTLAASIAVGYVHRGSEFMTMVRVQVILLLFFVLMNMYDVRQIISSTIKIVYFVGIVNVLISLLSFLQVELWRVTIYPDFISYFQYMWFGLYLSVFSYSMLLNKIFIHKKSSFVDYLLIVIILVVVLINITNKPIFLATLIVTFTTFLVFFRARVKRLKIAFIGLMIFLSPVFVYHSLNDEQKILFIYTVSQRFLKQEAYTWDDVIENVTQVEASGGKDISAGRFELWQSYFMGSVHSPIVSRNYGHKNITVLSAMGDSEVDMAAHNSVAHYTYYAGYIAGVSLALLILYFFRTTFSYTKRVEYYKIASRYNIKEYQLHGLLAFIYAIIGVELVGGPLMNAKFSWFWWILVVFILKVISEYRVEQKCINSQL